MKKQIQFNHINEEDLLDLEIIEQTPKFVLFNLEGVEYAVNLGAEYGNQMNLTYEGSNYGVIGVDTHFVVNGHEFMIDSPRKSRSKSKGKDVGEMKSPMPGKILKILVSTGAEVEIGTPILVMEAMKMEHTIKASKKGVVEKILFKEGDQVQGGVELVKLC
jgi:biotin carboxyl carrier protein